MHHAQLLVGSYDWACTVLPENFQHESEDVRHLINSRLGIDDVRQIISEAYRTPVIDEKRTFVIACAQITHEAQNALLKILEEPPLTAQFFIVVEREEILLKTVQSRLHFFLREENHNASTESMMFFETGIAARLDEIGKRMLKKDEKWAREILRAIEIKAHTERNVTALKTLSALRPFYDMSGASRKMILEHLSFKL